MSQWFDDSFLVTHGNNKEGELFMTKIIKGLRAHLKEKRCNPLIKDKGDSDLQLFLFMW